MPLLDQETHEELLQNALTAGLVDDHVGMQIAILPLVRNGDAGDGWLFACGCIQVISNEMPRPAEGTKVGFGFGKIDPQTGEIDLDLDPDGSAVIPLEVEEKLPEQVVFMRMLVADIADDTHASMSAFFDAVMGKFVPKLFSLLLHEASGVLRTKIASLQ